MEVNILTVRILSLDFDGCLFHPDYCYSQKKDVIAHNVAFLEQLKQENSNYRKVITMVGSNRQSKSVDFLNAWMAKKGSCFPAIAKVNEYLSTTLDPFLLADIYGNLPNGSAYKMAMDETTEINAHPEWKFDETKASILYAQVHKAALAYPNEDIVLDFYDDRGNGARSSSDILEWLATFYEQYTQLLPQNVTLRLHQYAGAEVTDLAEIKGTGSVDLDYRQTVKDMAKITIEKEPHNDGINQPIFVSHNVTPELLSEKKVQFMQNPTADLSEINKQELQVLKVHLDKLKIKATLFQSQAQQNAYQACSQLYQTLFQYAQRYQSHTFSLEEFKVQSQKTINTAHYELAQHRNCNYLLANLALFIGSLGIGYLAAATTNLLTTGNFLFFNKTDSSQKLESLEQDINNIPTLS